jgi:uncharacterized membrane-anchored protein
MKKNANFALEFPYNSTNIEVIRLMIVGLCQSLIERSVPTGNSRRDKSMKRLYTLMTVLIALGMASLAHAVTSDLPATQRAINEEVISLPWKYELKQYSLKKSHSTFTLAKGYSLLMGEAARRYGDIAQVTKGAPNTEAMVFNHSTGVQLIFNYHHDGYVALDDWGNLDAHTLMQEISSNTKKINAARAKNNIPPLRIGDWLQKPRLNKDNHSVSWVFDIMAGDETKVNAVTIKLGRRGYEKITWVSSYDNYLKSMDAMPFIADRHTFNKGHRYSDYTLGDQTAAFRIASLVAVMAGGNPLKEGSAAFYAGLATIRNNVLVSALIVLGTVGAFFRKRFGGRTQRFQTDPVLVLNLLKEEPSDSFARQEF